MQNKSNACNSSIIQAILDLKSTGKYGNDKALEDIVKELEANPSITKEADARFNARKYNEDSVGFSQIPLLSKNMLELSGNALRMLILLQGYMTQDNLAEINTNTVCEVLSISKDVFKRTKRELVQANAIVEIEGGYRGSSPIYRVNPRLAHHCKNPDSLAKDFWDDVKASQIRELSKVTDCNPDDVDANRDDDFKKGIGYTKGTRRANKTTVGFLDKPKKEPSDVPPSADSITVETNSPAKKIPHTGKKVNKSKEPKKVIDDMIPGQMTIDDPEIQAIFGKVAP